MSVSKLAMVTLIDVDPTLCKAQQRRIESGSHFKFYSFLSDPFFFSSSENIIKIWLISLWCHLNVLYPIFKRLSRIFQV